MRMRWNVLLLLLLFAAPSEAATINAASCSAADVQTAINSASQGDTVLVPSGNCTWSTNSVEIPNTKGITLQGAGIGKTVITGSSCSNAAGYMILSVADGNAITRVTGFSFNLVNGGCNSLKIGIVVGGGTTNPAWRIDHNRIYNCTGRCIKTWGGTAKDIKGLIDHNTIECPTAGRACHGLDFTGGTGGDGTGRENFARPLAWGSNNAVYAEDNTFIFVDMQDNVFDAYGGMRAVFRNNTVINTMPGMHGADSGGKRGVHSLELYRNTFTITTGPNVFTAFNHRSGSILQWGNTWSDKFNSPGKLQIYRVDNPSTYALWGMCDGTKVFDGNGTPTGYPCLDQTGWFFDNAAGPSNAGTFTLVPVYFWSNVQNGSPQAIPEANTAYIANNREYYTSTGASCTSGGSCVSGVGVGTSLPTSCTTGVAYWKTDEGDWDRVQSGPDGVLYKCMPTNTWTLYYTPYTYPHPLQSMTVYTSSSPPSPPANLVVTQ